VNRFVAGGDDENAKDKVIKLFKTVDDYAKEINLEDFSEFAGLYQNIDYQNREIPFSKKVLSISLESAELIKVTANAFLATKISFANSIARLCDVTGANIDEVMDGIGRDERIGRSFLYAGLGWGGGCFPKDTAGLLSFSKKNNFDFPMLAGVIKTNFEQVDFVADIVTNIIKNDIGQDPEKVTISVLGLSFKPGTSDIRMSPPISLIKKLLTGTRATIKVFDPKAMEEAHKEFNDGKSSKTDGKKSEANIDLNRKVVFCADAYSALQDTDIVIIGTQWPEFKKIDFARIRDKSKDQYFIDARNLYSKKIIEDLGFKYKGIGR
jgi:UDPglucose 6-dehydrogenase